MSYPGLPSHPQHALLQRMANPGGRPAGGCCARLCSCMAGWLAFSRLGMLHEYQPAVTSCVHAFLRAAPGWEFDASFKDCLHLMSVPPCACRPVQATALAAC